MLLQPPASLTELCLVHRNVVILDGNSQDVTVSQGHFNVVPGVPAWHGRNPSSARNQCADHQHLEDVAMGALRLFADGLCTN